MLTLKQSRRLNTWLVGVLAWAVALLLFFPILWMLMTSFKTEIDAFATPLAKAQLGAALALYGDRARSSTAFQAAVASLGGTEDRTSYRRDYGSLLRDTAGVLALAAEFTPSGVDLGKLAADLVDKVGFDN